MSDVRDFTSGGRSMFELPEDLKFNRGPVTDPAEYFQSRGCASWLLLTGDVFAAMPGGISYAEVQRAAPESKNVVSDPPVTLDLAIAREHVRALEELPRPTNCLGRRSSHAERGHAGPPSFTCMRV
jgi:hypothetical protein